MAKGQMHSNKAGQEQEEGRRSDLTVQTRLLVRQPIRQEALVSSPNGANDGGAIEDEATCTVPCLRLWDRCGRLKTTGPRQ
jgi:hypothetical protein